MTKEKILYNNVKVFFRSMIYNIKYNKDMCPLCFKKIQDKDEVYLIMNNCVLFPNIFVHRACVDSKSNCIRHLIASYEEAKRVTKKYNFWFPKNEEGFRIIL